MLKGIHHLAISTPDIDGFVDWYCDVLGFQRAGAGGWEAGDERIDTMVGLKDSAARYQMIRLGNLYIEVFEYNTPRGHEVHPRMCDHGIIHLCLYCDDITNDYARLIDKGMRFRGPPGGSAATRATYGEDCDGNIVELLQIVDPACAFAYEKTAELASA